MFPIRSDDAQVINLTDAESAVDSWPGYDATNITPQLDKYNSIACSRCYSHAFRTHFRTTRIFDRCAAPLPGYAACWVP